MVSMLQKQNRGQEMKKVFLVLLFALFACKSLNLQEKKVTIEEIKEEDFPKVVAIMPFEGEDRDITLLEQLRKTFYNHFAGKNYTNIELPLVDEKLYQLEKSKGKRIREFSASEICASLGCDALIYGKVTDFQKIYAVAYSQLGIEVEVWMVDGKNNKEIFRIKDSVRYHEGGIPLSPLGAVMTAVSTALNLIDIQQIRLLNEICYKIVEKIPSPPTIASIKLPKIKEVVTNVVDSPFGIGKVIRVGLEGDSGMIACFDIGNFRKCLPMKEIKTGIYTGEYAVMPGDNINKAPIVVYLKKPGGYENRWIDVSGFVTIDTEPPQDVKNIKVKKYYDRIEIRWSSLKSIPDLKGYMVYRSDKPLSDYKLIATVEDEIFEDRNIEKGKIYYYRLTAVDLAGNESQLCQPVKGYLVSETPEIVNGEINRDTILHGNFVINDKLIVLKGSELIIESGTTIKFDENAYIEVRGNLYVDGLEEPVQFISNDDRKFWKGIVVNGGKIKLNGLLLKNALEGVFVSEGSGDIENLSVTNSNIGIMLKRVRDLNIKKASIFNNEAGILIEDSNLKITESNVFQNYVGIRLKKFSGEIFNNNIFDNYINVWSEEEFKIGTNYFGSINVDEMKLDRVIVEKVYDKKIPEGKATSAIYNPYAKLSEEERKTKSAELVIEAGNYFRQRNYGKAVMRFEEALKILPSPEVYYYIALCYKEMNENDKTIRFLEDGYKLFPTDTTIVKALGLAYYESNEFKKAKEFFEKLLKLNPEDNQIKFILEKIKNY